jgi:hypothetical protein
MGQGARPTTYDILDVGQIGRVHLSGTLLRQGVAMIEAAGWHYCRTEFVGGLDGWAP